MKTSKNALKAMVAATIIAIAFSGLWLYPSGVNAQGVGINSSGSSPNSSAGLDVNFTNKGTLITRMTTTQRDAIPSPAQSLMIFNSTTNCFEYWANGVWQSLGCACSSAPASPVAGSLTPSQNQIVWSWSNVSGATGYKWNTTNNYGTATDNGASTIFNQLSLTCNTAYNLYVWAYNPCGNSAAKILTQTTSACDACGGLASMTDSRDGKVYNIVTVGTQCWMKQNLDYGTYVAIATGQGAVGTQKYCYNDNAANCTSGGGLYEWAEIMNGSSPCNGTGSSQPACSVPVQGICPTGWHIPSHYEWVQVERQVCTSATCATDFPYDVTTTGPRGVNEATKLILGGSSGLDIQLVGYSYGGSFFWGGTGARIWTSTEYASDNAYSWDRQFPPGSTMIARYPDLKQHGFALRCIKN